jgi:hypothetical protein
MDPIPFPPHRWQRCITIHSSTSNLKIDPETKTQASPLIAEQSNAIRDRGQLPFAIKNQGRITIHQGIRAHLYQEIQDTGAARHLLGKLRNVPEGSQRSHGRPHKAALGHWGRGGRVSHLLVVAGGGGNNVAEGQVGERGLHGVRIHPCFLFPFALRAPASSCSRRRCRLAAHRICFGFVRGERAKRSVAAARSGERSCGLRRRQN